MVDSPLSEPDPDSLTHLFNLDPDEFTGPDDPRLVKMVMALRADRARWDLNEKKKAAAPKKVAGEKLSLGDLDL